MDTVAKSSFGIGQEIIGRDGAQIAYGVRANVTKFGTGGGMSSGVTGESDRRENELMGGPKAAIPICMERE
jgi:hypothetical protein